MKFDRIVRFFDVQTWGALLLLSMVVGLLSGAAAVIFQALLHFLQEEAIGVALGADPGMSRYVLIVGLPVAGGLISGFLVFKFAPETEGHGTDSMIRAFHRLKGEIRARVPLLKAVASGVTIGFGGSAGKEGPIAQIGAGLGSVLSEKLRLDSRWRRILLLAGAAAGVGAIFRTPLGGAIFAVEVLYRESDFEYEALVPCVFSSICAYAVFTYFYPDQEFLFIVTEGIRFQQNRELILYALLGILCAAMGYLYVRMFYGSRDLIFRRMAVPVYFRPALGGLVLGTLAIWLPEVLSGGYDVIQSAIDDKLGAVAGGNSSELPWHAFRLLFVLVIAKMLAVSLTISSGGSGGVFGPSLYIGAMIGGSFGYLVEAVSPGLIPETTRVSFILVGMGGFFAGVAKVPIASLIMVTEMTGSYGLIVPLMLTCAISFLLSRKWSLYEEQVPSQVDSPAHLGDFIVNILEDIRVKDVFAHEHRQFHSVHENTTLWEISGLIQQSFQNNFPVLDNDDKLVGMISFDTIREVIHDEIVGRLVLAQEICETDFQKTLLTENLHQVLRKMTQQNIEVLPVVDSIDRNRMLGFLTRQDIMVSYDRKLNDLRDDAGLPVPAIEDEAIPFHEESVITDIKVLKHHVQLNNKQVMDVAFPHGSLLISIQRGKEHVIPNGLTQIAENDRLMIVSKRHEAAEFRRFLTTTPRTADGEE